VFLDTNVLVSAFATRGLCADLFRCVVSENELIVGEVVISELQRVLRNKLKLPQETIDEIEALLREHTVIEKPSRPASIPLADRSDRWIVASALAGGSDVLVTGDAELLELADRAPLPIVDPRGLWSSIRG